jgi:ABC-type Fe3+-hydroxamate transport system substrate-binding protein
LLTDKFIVSKDQTGRKVKIASLPQRIISTVPSISELLFDLDLNNEIVGVTKFCVHPSLLRQTKTIVGGTKNLNIEKIRDLNPDLIIANKEENQKEQIEKLEKYFPVWISDVDSLNSATKMISEIGTITARKKQAEFIVEKINIAFERLKQIITNENLQEIKVIYLVWNKPYMVAGSDTFISDLLQKCHLKNIVHQDRYPEITNSDIIKLNPDCIFLSSEPFPFKANHVQEFKEILPNAIVKLVDGEMYSWYGSHLINAPEYFIQVLKELNIKNHS